MRKARMIAAVALCVASVTGKPLAVMAQPVDMIGGADGSTQTMYHCGFLQLSAQDYADSPVLVEIIEHKLRALGYTQSMASSRSVTHSRKHGKSHRSRGAVAVASTSARLAPAVKAFQADYGLPVDGVVGARTAQQLAYISHPSAHVRGCTAITDGSR